MIVWYPNECHLIGTTNIIDTENTGLDILLPSHMVE